MFLVPSANLPQIDVDSSQWQHNYRFVFVHGLGGWGSYDIANKFVPYWGVLGGDLMKYLNAHGFDCYAASVSPSDSTWDRTCELYAQLTGTRVDYGKEHSGRCGHKRYGKDYTGRALIDGWNGEDKINLLGHSFGGATIRMLTSLMAYGSEEEMAVTPADEISQLFTGGKADYIYSVTTLASPTNGTTAYPCGYYVEEAGGSLGAVLETKLLFMVSHDNLDGRVHYDSCEYDMTVDGAAEINQKIKTVPDVYYFAYAGSASHQDENGKWVPDDDCIEPLFVNSAKLMCEYTGVTDGGMVLDESWQQNDGLVNTISAFAPFNAPQREFDQNNIEPGVWNNMPVFHGDHLSMMGGILKYKNVRPFYIDILCMINGL